MWDMCIVTRLVKTRTHVLSCAGSNRKSAQLTSAAPPQLPNSCTLLAHCIVSSWCGVVDQLIRRFINTRPCLTWHAWRKFCVSVTEVAAEQADAFHWSCYLNYTTHGTLSLHKFKFLQSVLSVISDSYVYSNKGAIPTEHNLRYCNISLVVALHGHSLLVKQIQRWFSLFKARR